MNMKVSGSMRRIKYKFGRAVVSRELPLPFTFKDGTALPGSDAHFSEPGYFFPVAPSMLFCKVLKPAPQRTFTSYLIPLELKSRLGATRSNRYE